MKVWLSFSMLIHAVGLSLPLGEKTHGPPLEEALSRRPFSLRLKNLAVPLPLAPSLPRASRRPQKTNTAPSSRPPQGKAGTPAGRTPMAPLRPHYPLRSRQQGHEGQVTAMAVIAAEGRVERVFIIKSSGLSELDGEAVRTLREALFAPSSTEDEQVFTFTFKLR